MRIATVGTFDGVHKGHQLLLSQLREMAKEREATPLVFVLTPHPLSLIAPERAPKLLSSPQQRLEMISRLLPEAEVRLLHFDERLRHLTHRDFMRMLRDEYGVSGILVGYDNRFGSDVNASFADYQASAAALGIETEHCQALPGVSSSAVRKALLCGEVSKAADMLGHPYTLEGKVVHGNKIGRSIGFPTANLLPDEAERLVPGRGVYAALALTPHATRKAIVNIGSRPTVDSSQNAPITIEAHLLDYQGDIYNQPMALQFVDRIRDEKQFPSLDALTSRLKADAEKAKTLLGNIQPKI